VNNVGAYYLSSIKNKNDDVLRKKLQQIGNNINNNNNTNHSKTDDIEKYL